MQHQQIYLSKVASLAAIKQQLDTCFRQRLSPPRSETLTIHELVKNQSFPSEITEADKRDSRLSKGHGVTLLTECSPLLSLSLFFSLREKDGTRKRRLTHKIVNHEQRARRVVGAINGTRINHEHSGSPIVVI